MIHRFERSAREKIQLRTTVCSANLHNSVSQPEFDVTFSQQNTLAPPKDGS